jgi:hypothetical protein
MYCGPAVVVADREAGRDTLGEAAEVAPHAPGG